MIVGPTRTGKTEWARSLGPHIYWNGQVNLDDWNDEADYIILDDFNWDYFHYQKQFFGAQKTFTMTDKYRRKKTITWGKPCIILCNPECSPLDGDKPINNHWFSENVVDVYLTSPLF